ncbi:hypothetical protein R6Q59_011491 [Mikania micrantha]
MKHGRCVNDPYGRYEFEGKLLGIYGEKSGAAAEGGDEQQEAAEEGGDEQQEVAEGGGEQEVVDGDVGVVGGGALVVCASVPSSFYQIFCERGRYEIERRVLGIYGGGGRYTCPLY